MTERVACTPQSGASTAASPCMGALLTSVRESAIGDVSVDGGLRRHVESASGARGDGVCGHGEICGLEILHMFFPGRGHRLENDFEACLGL